MQYIPAENLANNLVNTFLNYVTLYGVEYLDQAFNHIEERPDEIEEGEEKKDLLYYETIIESGFYAYFLLISYNDVMKNDEISIDWSDDYNEAKNLLSSFKSSLKKSRTNFMSKSQKTGEFTVDEKVTEILQMNKSEAFAEACKFFRRHSSSIELLRDGKLEKVLFYLPTYSTFLKSNLQNAYEVQVDRSSTKTKVLDLQLNSKNLISKAKQEYRIHIRVKKSKLLNFIFSYPDLWPAISFYTLMATVMIIVFSYRYDSFADKPDRPQFLGYFYDF
jgi:hypothetical protein